MKPVIIIAIMRNRDGSWDSDDWRGWKDGKYDTKELLANVLIF